MSNLHLAINVATNYHNNTWRKDKVNKAKLPYICHPLEVLKKIYRWGLSDEDARIAAVLHDTVEDCGADADKERLESMFGKRAISIIYELTLVHRSMSQEDWLNTKQAYIESFRTKSIEALIIKIADRLCNIQDFIDTNFDYAPKYYLQSTRLFNIWHERIDMSNGIHLRVNNELETFITKCNRLFS